MGEYIVPMVLAVTAVSALRKREKAYDILVDGAREGFQMLLTIAPCLVVLLSAVGMLRASGALEALSAVLSPALEFVGIPPETVLLMLVRPISGSAALAIGAELIAQYGVDSLIGRTAGCATPFDILPCVWVSSILSVSAGLLAAWALGRVWRG